MYKSRFIEAKSCSSGMLAVNPTKSNSAGQNYASCPTLTFTLTTLSYKAL